MPTQFLLTAAVSCLATAGLIWGLRAEAQALACGYDHALAMVDIAAAQAQVLRYDCTGQGQTRPASARFASLADAYIPPTQLHGLWYSPWVTAPEPPAAATYALADERRPLLGRGRRWPSVFDASPRQSPLGVLDVALSGASSRPRPPAWHQ
jgi:hypothetical protein